MKQKKRSPEDSIRRRVEKKYEARSGLAQHAIAYLMTNLVLWAIWIFTSASFPWPLFVTFFWGIGMLNDFWDYYYKYGRGARKREAEIAAELAMFQRYFEEDETEGALVFELDKVQQRGLRLADDGEIADQDSWDEFDAPERSETQ